MPHHEDSLGMTRGERATALDYGYFFACLGAFLLGLAAILYVLMLGLSGVKELVIGDVHCFKSFALMDCIQILPR